MGSHVHLQTDNFHKHVTVRLLLHICCQLTRGGQFWLTHSALTRLLLYQTMISTVFETCNAVCRITLLLEPCVSLLQPSNFSNGCKENSSLPACVFVFKLSGNAGTAEPQHTNHCYRLSQC